jgi:hypothetical protein
MRALYFDRHGGPEVLILGARPAPVLGPGQVRIDVRAASLNHIDIFLRRGLPGLKIEFPHIPGCDASGVVSEAGAGVTGLKTGDRTSFGRASREALAQPWSFIGLLGGQLYAAVRTAAAQVRALEAADAHWPVLAAVGARYTHGSNVGKLLADTHTLVTFCLARQGAPVRDLQDLTPARLHEHIAHLPGYRPYDEGAKGGYFVKNPDGSTYVGKVWPGDSVFPDFTRNEVRAWWGTLYTDFVKMGIRGFWNDMNEPSVFEVASKTAPLDTVHSVEGRITDHREISAGLV